MAKKKPEMSAEAKVLEAAEAKRKKDAALEKVHLGTKETKDVLQLAFAIAKIVKEAKANDGIFSSADLMLLVNLFPHFGPAFEGMEKIKPELQDLDSEEVKDLLKFTAAHLGGVFDKPEMVAKVEAGLKLGLAIAEMIKVMK